MITLIEHGHTYTFTKADVAIIAILVLWELVWKGLALYKAGRNRQLAWFIVMLILNTAGILEIVYLLFFQKKSHSHREV